MDPDSLEKVQRDRASFKDLITQFRDIHHKTLTGNTIVRVADRPSRMFSFDRGRLSGISGGEDLADCWRRNLEIAKLNSPVDSEIGDTSDKKVPSKFYVVAQKLVTSEVLFDLIQICQCTQQQLSYQFIPIEANQLKSNSNLRLLDIQPMLARAIRGWQAWQNAGLSDYFPNQFLQIQDSVKLLKLIRVDSSFATLLSIDGRKSLRNLAADRQQDLLKFTTHLLPLLTVRAISLSPVQIDRIETKNLDRNSANDNALKRAGSLIACIDDSIVVYKNLERFLTDRGYRSYAVQDPLKAILTLIKQKPDLIFLDLLMPIANGYEICQQIRKTPSLKHIPIIILTAKDGLFDRMRAKAIGANEFLSKPICNADILRILGKYLGDGG